MARRSYLSRLAQPITVGDPVIRSIPRAPAEQSRQSVPAAGRSLPGSPRPPSIRPPARPDDPAAKQDERRHTAPYADDPRTPTQLGYASGPALLNGRRDSESFSPEARSLEPAVVATSAELGPEPARTASGAPPMPSPPRPFRTAQVPTPAPDSPFAPAAALPPFEKPARPDSPKLHIGTIEVRSVSAAPPPPAPIAPVNTASATAPPAGAPPAISRSYASRFGLAQG